MKKHLFILALVLLANASWGQFTELGFGGGGTYLHGDVGALTVLPTDYQGHLSLRRQYNWHWATRLNYTRGFLKQDDQWSSREFPAARNIAVRTEFGEVSYAVEFNYWPYATGTKYNQSFFIFAGFGLTAYTPRGLYNDTWYDLRELGTEGQGTELANSLPYNDLALTYPLGIGYRRSFSRDFSMAAEVGWRKYGTDYIDDTSDKYVDAAELADLRGEVAGYFANPGNVNYVPGLYRGNPNTNDWSIFAGITIYYNLSPRNERCDGF